MILQKWWDWRAEDESWRHFLIPRVEKTCDEWCNPVLSFYWGPINVSWWYKLENRQDLWFMIGATGRKQYNFVSPDYTAWATVNSTPELDASWDSLEDENWHPPLWSTAKLIDAGAKFESLED